MHTKHGQKKFTFAEINDGSSLKGIQVVIDASVAINGKLVESPAKGQRIEIHVAPSWLDLGSSPSQQRTVK